MKNKAPLLIALGMMVISLTACNYIPFFKNNGEYSDRNSNSFNESDYPVSGDVTAQKASFKYSDLIDNSVYNLSCTPSIGSPKLLVIPVWFTDSNQFIKDSSKKETVRNDINSAYFGKAKHVLFL